MLAAKRSRKTSSRSSSSRPSKASKKTKAPELDDVTRYAHDVLAGKILTGKPVRLACKRHLDDLEQQESLGIRWRPDLVTRVIEFFGSLLTVEVAGEAVPFVLLPFQRFIVGSLFGWLNVDGTRRYRNAYIEIGKGPLALDTPIPTPTGWSTMGALRVGDQVFDEAGQPCKVTDISEIFLGHKCYKIKFSDNCEIVSDSEHQWKAAALRTGGKKGPKPADAPRKGGYALRSTEQIANTLAIGESTSKYPQAKWNYRVDVCGPLCTPAAVLPIPPYTFGAWLGDGNSADARMTIAFADWEIADHIKSEFVSVDIKPNRRNGKQSETTGRVLLGSAGKTQKSRDRSVQAALARLGVLGNKHIPMLYLRSSIDQRLALLQGIMDTDGTIAKDGRVELTLCYRPLAESVIELLRTLGYKPTVNESDSKLNGRTVGRRWRILFQPYSDTPPFRLSRKVARLHRPPATRPLSKGRMIVGCQIVRSVPVRCITVDAPSHLYLAGAGMIPTHNSGKTPLAAGIGIYGLIADGELSPEVYSAATMREQAAICFKDAVKMVQRSPELAAIIEERVGSLLYAGNGGVFRPLSSEHKALDGKRVHIAIVDELHEHPTSLVVDKMRAGTKNRHNALIFRITNSGSDLESVCWHEHEYSLKILDGVIKDESWFAYVCSLDEGDDWQNESIWVKANPGLGNILPVQYLREQVREASGMPTKQNLVKRLNFCIWTQQHTIWIPQEQWQACNQPIPANELLDAPCWGGLDLSTKLDLTALVLAFRRQMDTDLEIEVPAGDDPQGKQQRKRLNLNFGVDLVPFFYIPEDTMHQRAKEDRIPYPLWAEQGFIFPTPGNIVDYDYIFDHFLDEIAPKYSVQQIGYDPYNATQFALNLQSAGFQVVEVRQGAQTMSEPAKVFEALVRARRVRHKNHPVLSWNVSNVAAREDKKGNIFPYKQHQRKRIDGVIASIMAISRLIVAPVNAGSSVYDERPSFLQL